MTPHPRVQDLYDGLLWSIDLAQWGILAAMIAVGVLCLVKYVGGSGRETAAPEELAPPPGERADERDPV